MLSLLEFLFGLKTLKVKRFSTIIYILQTLLEQGPTLPSYVRRHGVAKIVLGTWLLLAVIATNGYRGIVTTKFVVPPRTTNLSTIKDTQATKVIKKRHPYDIYKEFNGIVSLTQIVWNGGNK